MKKGDKYGMLTAIRFIRKDKKSHYYWLFKCDCGNEKVIRTSEVEGGGTKACGCLRGKNNITHGMTNTREFSSWFSMRERCGNKSDPSFHNYGGRGITVCKCWLGEKGFQNFYKDMGERPKNKTLDRIDNNKGYRKDNCRWATQREQLNNTRRNHFLTYNGRRRTIAQWARAVGLSYNTLWYRINSGWTTNKALN